MAFFKEIGDDMLPGLSGATSYDDSFAHLYLGWLPVCKGEWYTTVNVQAAEMQGSDVRKFYHE
jgi:hypothetical protein